MLTFYSGLQNEESRYDISYTFDTGIDDLEPTAIDFSMTNINRIRGIVGLGVMLGPVNFSMDVNMSKRTTVSAGLGVVF